MMHFFSQCKILSETCAGLFGNSWTNFNEITAVCDMVNYKQRSQTVCTQEDWPAKHMLGKIPIAGTLQPPFSPQEITCYLTALFAYRDSSRTACISIRHHKEQVPFR